MLVVVAYYSVDMVTDCTVHQEHVGTLKLCLYGAVAKLYTVWCRFKTLTLCSFLETGSTQYQVSVVLQTCANLWLRSPGLPGGPLLSCGKLAVLWRHKSASVTASGPA